METEYLESYGKLVLDKIYLTMKGNFFVLIIDVFLK